MDPMMVRGALIQPHYITFEITCTKDRKMHNLHFLQPSYDGTLNAYITKIAQAMTPPLLPSVLPQDEAAILVCVKVERIYQQSSIYFVQRFD